MPPRRARSNGYKKTDDTKNSSDSQENNELNEILGELMKLYNDVNPDDIFNCKHPLEIKENQDSSNISRQISLTPIQKAITFCIQHNGDSATDDEILAFIHKFWAPIVSYGLRHNNGPKYQLNNPMNKRVLHINLAIAKDGKSLFLKTDENRWKLNSSLTSKVSTQNSFQTTIASSRHTQRTLNAPRSSAASGTNTNYFHNSRTSAAFPNSSDTANLFQDKIIEILKSANDQSLTLPEIIEQAEQYETLDGIYPSYPLDKRVKIVLTIKKVFKEVDYNEDTMKWSIVSKPIERERSISLPKELKGIKIKDISVGELWSILKEKQIY